MAKTRGYYNHGKYNFTARRRAQLKRAQAISARKRKTNAIKAAVVLAGVGAIAFAGYKNRGTINNKISKVQRARTLGRSDWRKAVAPENKEITRVASAISVAGPSSTRITEVDRARARNTRNAMAAQDERKRGRGAATDGRSAQREARSVRSTIRNGRRGRLNDDNSVKSITQLVEEGKKVTRGRKTASLRSTPGGTKTPKKANPKNQARDIYEDMFSDETNTYTLLPEDVAGSKTKTTSSSRNSSKLPAPTTGTNGTKNAKPRLKKPQTSEEERQWELFDKIMAKEAEKLQNQDWY